MFVFWADRKSGERCDKACKISADRINFEKFRPKKTLWIVKNECKPLFLVTENYFTFNTVEEEIFIVIKAKKKCLKEGVVLTQAWLQSK